jgi:hypothetical protein
MGLVTVELPGYNHWIGVRNEQDVKIPLKPAENSRVLTSQTGVCQSRRRRAPEFERPSVPNPDENRIISQVEADRLRLIQQRLQNDFYEIPPASERIAVAVLAELRDLEESASALPH